VAEDHRRGRGEHETRHDRGGGRIGDLKLGLNTGYWAGGPPPNITETIAEAETLGFDSIWTAEAYGSDGLTPLAWWGSQTQTLQLGTAITQMSARQPAMTAMSAMTMDHLSGGRFILGLGVSGPQVVEGWYGMPFAKPLARTREYIQILRDIWARKGPVTLDGEHYTLPYKGDDATGLGKPLKASIHPLREDIPIYLGAEGPKNIALAGELCDGWLAMLFSPGYEDFYKDALSEGFARDGARRSFDDFEVAATVPLIVTDDVDAGVDMLRPFYALYFGGMGAKGKNFHANVAIRMGYEQMVDDVADLYLSGKKDEAGAKIPSELVQKLSLIGPKEKLREDIQAWRESIVTTLLITGDIETIRTAAEVVLG
jgi:F420-dependent oxidoreductase-like protein